MAKVYPFFLAGQWQQSEEWLEVRSPYDGEVVGVTSVPSEEQVKRAIEGAVSAFELTRRLSSEERAGILTRIRDGVARRGGTVVLVDAKELALDGGEVLGVLRVAAELADGNVEVAVGPEVEVARDMVDVGRVRLGQVAQNGGGVIAPTVAVGEAHDDRPRQIPSYGSHEVDVEVVVGGEVRVQGQAQESPFALGSYVDVGERLWQEPAPGGNDAAVAAAELGVEEASIGGECEGSGEGGVGDDDLRGEKRAVTAPASGRKESGDYRQGHEGQPPRHQCLATERGGPGGVPALP